MVEWGRVTTPTRQERKQQTRDALIGAALGLSEFHSFDHLSLRQVTKEVGIVPGGFYRHFHDMDELGLALVERCFTTLYDLIDHGRDRSADPTPPLDTRVWRMIEHVGAHPAEYRFIVRERNGGSPGLRRAIAVEQARYTAQLASNLGRAPRYASWDDADLTMLAGLLVEIVARAARAVVDPQAEPVDRSAVARSTVREVRLVLLGSHHWSPARA